MTALVKERAEVAVGALVGPKHVKKWLHELAQRRGIAVLILETGLFNKTFHIEAEGESAAVEGYWREVASTINGINE